FLSMRCAVAQVFRHGPSVAGEHYAPGVLLSLIRVHRVVVFIEQARYPSAVQIQRAAAPLLGQGGLHDAREPLIPFTTQALDYPSQEALQSIRKSAETCLMAQQGDKLRTQVDYIIAQNALDTPLKAVFHPNQRIAGHILMQCKRQ